MNIYALSLNPETRDMMLKHGVRDFKMDERSLEEISGKYDKDGNLVNKPILDEKIKEFVNLTVDYLSNQYYESVNQVYENVNYVIYLTKEDNYIRSRIIKKFILNFEIIMTL